jgi:hypothetical protein
MNTRSTEARLLALEAAVQALALTHPKPQDAFFRFSQIYPDMVRDLNKSGLPENAEIAKELVAECNRLAHYFPK